MTLRGLLRLAAIAATLIGCADRRVEEEGESHRHLAEEFCAEWCPWWTACEPTLAEWPVDECRESCESDEAWDWTDECGDLKWEYRKCRSSLTCEEARSDPEIPGTDDPCQPVLDEIVVKECTYDRPHGG